VLTSLRTVYARDVDSIRAEVELYPEDALLWKDVPGCPNPGGTLVLHLVGNLRHFIGAQLGATGYVRNRDAEFALRDLTRAQLLEQVAAAADDVSRTLGALEATRLDEPFPLPMYGKSVKTELWLLHLSTHLAFHLGQLDYHRRTVTGNRMSAGAVAIPPLFAP
jgi:hypothetical protein